MTIIRRSHQGESSIDAPQMGYAIAFVSMMVLVVMIFKNRGVPTCTAVILYLTSLSTMSLVLKSIFVEQRFDFPLMITSCHFLCTSCVALIILLNRSASTGKPLTVLQPQTLLKGVGPVALCFSLSVGLCNTGLSFSNAHFYEMVDTATPLVTAFLTMAMGKPYHNHLMAPLGLVTFSLMCCWSGEVHFSLVAFICLMTGTILRAFKGVLNQMLMSESTHVQVLDPVELVMYTGVVSFGVMGTWSLIQDGFQPYRQLYELGAYPAAFSVALSVVNAIVINFAGIYVIRDLGAVAQQLTGCLKSVLTVLGGVAIRGEYVSWSQMVAYVGLLAGIAWYNHMDKKLKDAGAMSEATKAAAGLKST